MIATPVSTRTLSAPARRWLLALLLLAPVARGHSPHDVANMVRVSPDFTDDQTVFAAFLLTEHDLLGRSRDAGRSWELMAPPWVLGDFSAIEISPGFALDRTLFASSPTLGVFRSTDGGDSWAPVNAGLTDLRVSGLALSPGFAGDGVLLAVTESGCFRSADGGDSWVDASAGIVTVPLMAVHFASDSVAFAGGTVLHRSDDGGQTWAPVQVFSVPIATIAASPAFATDTSLTVCFGRYGNGIQISLDGGMNWAPWTLGLTDDFVNELSFAADGTVFAVTKEEGCFRAPGLGEPFSLLVEGFEHHSPLTPNHYLSVSVSPAYPVDQTVFVAAFEGLHRSQNGGELWVQQDVYTQRINRRIDVRRKGGGLELLLGNYGSGLQISHPIFEELGAAPEGAQPLGAAGGVAPGGGGHGPGLAGAPALSAQPALGPPTGLAWTPRADGLGALWTEVLEVSPGYERDGTLLFGHLGLWLSTDRGVSWTKLPLPPWDFPVRAAAFSPDWSADQMLLVARQEGGVLRSDDAGQQWEVLDGIPFEDSMSFIRVSPGWPADPVVLISAKSGNVYRSGDACISWKPCGGLPGTEVRAFALSPDFGVDRVALAGTAGDGLYLSLDAGQSWEPSNTGLPAGIPLVVEGLAFSPDFAVDETVFVSLLSGGVHRSEDGGRTWTLVSQGLPPAAPRVLGVSSGYAQDGTLVLLTHDWAWLSQDQGVHWEQLPGLIRVDDGHPAVTYEGDWKPAVSPGCVGLGGQLSLAEGDSTELEFLGRTIEWFARRGPFEGAALVYVDGRFDTLVTLAQPQIQNGVTAFSKSFGSVGWHKIRVVNAGPFGSHLNRRVVGDGFAYTF